MHFKSTGAGQGVETGESFRGCEVRGESSPCLQPFSTLHQEPALNEANLSNPEGPIGHPSA